MSSNTGAQRQIFINNMSLNGVVESSRVVNDEKVKGILESYNLEEYGLTQDFFIPDNSMIGFMAGQRKARSMMPLDYENKTAKDFDWSRYNEDTQAQKNIANAFILKFKEFQSKGMGLFISSKTKGSGKTFLACCLTNEILKKHDISVKFITIPDYLEFVKSKDSKDTIESIMNCSLLILDDVIETSKKEWIDNTFFRLVDYRKRNKLSTIFTSNYAMDDLPIEERIKERIIANSIPLYMPEVNLRREEADKAVGEFLKEVLNNENN